MLDRSDKVLLTFLLLAVIAAGILAWGRARIEQGNRAVEIIIDADDARQAAAAAGVNPVELLEQLRDAGASALAVRELAVGDLFASARLLTMSAPGHTRILVPDAELALLLLPALKARLPQLHAEMIDPPLTFGLDLDMQQLAQVPVILRPEDLRAARTTGLHLVARMLNFPAVSPHAIESAAAEAEAAGATLVIFDKEEVLGYDGLLAETAEALRRHQLLYGFVEMAGQRGDEALARSLIPRIVRVHSISDSDMLTITPGVATARFARAVRERNVRACYVRLLLRPQRAPLEANVRYVRGVADALRKQGFEIGSPTPFSAPEAWPPNWLRWLAALALPCAALLLLRRLIPLTQSRVWLWFLGLAALGIAVALLRPGLVVPIGGLIAACVFPTLGLLAVLQAARGPGLRPSAFELVGLALTGLVVATAASVMGGMVIVALYSRVGYLYGIERFAGVKMSFLAPAALVVVAVIAELPGRVEPLAVWWSRTRLRVNQFFCRPVLILEALVILAALGAVGFLLMRTGNQPVLAPASVEVKLRSLLESFLLVRPRTKEFLIGHPALMLAFALALRGRRAYLPLFALLAAVGQASALNTFCHLHTPLYISFLRTGHGLWIGAIAGTAVILVWRLLFDRPPPQASR